VQVGGQSTAPKRILQQAVKAACVEMGVAAAEISVALLGDEDITALNRQHLGRDYAPDVLSFPLYQPGEPVVGDVYIGVDQASRQAEEAGVPLLEELVRLTVHGTLHVLGMDHPEDAEARAASPMYARQEKLVREVLG
jgi:probable rRNA maturation factor